MENKCFICAKSSNKVVRKENGFESRTCPECGLLYCTPLPTEEQVDLQKIFHYDAFYKMPARYKARWLAARTGTRKDLLEVGSGSGHQLKELADCGYHVAGLEPDLQRVQDVRDTYGFDTYQGFVESYNFGQKKFDVVFHVDLLAHFPDPYTAVEKMKNVINEDGLISFEVGIIGGVSPFWYKFFIFGLPQHRWLYSEKSISKFLDGVHLETVHKTTHSLIPYFIFKRISGIILISVLRRLLQPFIGKKVSVLFHIQHLFSNFLRYKVGRYFPGYGPLTILYVTKPI
jgi:SAM-dependent methyltransferase